jgi:hypothetical protein
MRLVSSRFTSSIGGRIHPKTRRVLGGCQLRKKICLPVILYRFFDICSTYEIGIHWGTYKSLIWQILVLGSTFYVDIGKLTPVLFNSWPIQYLTLDSVTATRIYPLFQWWSQPSCPPHRGLLRVTPGLVEIESPTLVSPFSSWDPPCSPLCRSCSVSIENKNEARTKMGPHQKALLLDAFHLGRDQEVTGLVYIVVWSNSHTLICIPSRGILRKIWNIGRPCRMALLVLPKYQHPSGYNLIYRVLPDCWFSTLFERESYSGSSGNSMESG